MLFLAQLLLQRPLDTDTVALLHKCISASWPLPTVPLLRQWLHTGSHSTPQGVVRGEGCVAGSFAAAVSALPFDQQLAVLEMLLHALQTWSAADLLLTGSSLQALADVVIRVWWAQRQVKAANPSGLGTDSGQQQQQREPRQFVELLTALDGSSGQVYMHLLTLAAGRSADHTTATNSAEQQQEQQQQAELHAAVRQLLPLCMLSAAAATAISGALRKLVSTIGKQQVVAAALSNLLWVQTHAEHPPTVAAVCRLALDATGAAASTQLLAALAAHRSSRSLTALVRLWVAASAPAPGPHATDLLLLLVRLLPHAPNSHLPASILQLVMQPGSMQLTLAGPEGEEVYAASSSHIWCLGLESREVTSFLQLLCRLDAAAHPGHSAATAVAASSTGAAADGGAEGIQGSFLQQYLSGLLQYLQAAADAAAAAAAVTAAAAAAAAAAGAVTTPPAAAAAAANAAGQFVHVVEQLAVGNAGGPDMQGASLAAALQQGLRAQLQAVTQLLNSSIPSMTFLANACLMLLLLPGHCQSAVQQMMQQAAAARGDSSRPSGLLQHPAAAVQFFSSQQPALQQAAAAVTAQDFTRIAGLLKAHIKSAQLAAQAPDSAEMQTRLPALGAAQQHLQAVPSDSTSGTYGLVMTPTTVDNLNHILQVVDNPTPMLLEGATGVGKSATVAEAACRMGKQLVRFNMSSSLTESDLLGRVQMKAGPDGTVMFDRQLQPFAAAFAAGDWLLLDELNLAPSDVLQCIEQALDTGVSALQDERFLACSLLPCHAHMCPHLTGYTQTCG
jgi:hypothetical protein